MQGIRSGRGPGGALNPEGAVGQGGWNSLDVGLQGQRKASWRRADVTARW